MKQVPAFQVALRAGALGIHAWIFCAKSCLGMAVEDVLLGELVRTLARSQHIVRGGGGGATGASSIWSLALPGGLQVIDVAIAVLLNVGLVGLDGLLSSLGRSQNPLVQAVLSVLRNTGDQLSFQAIGAFILRAVDFFRSLASLTSRLVNPSRAPPVKL